MFLFKRINKMIHTGNNGRGPGGPRLPSDRRSDADDRWPEYSCRWIRENDMFQIGEKFDRPLWLTVSSVYRQTMGTSGTCHGLVNS